MKRSITTLILLIITMSGNHILAQNSPPVAVNDSLIPIFDFYAGLPDTTLIINVLNNDYDPDGDSFKLFEVKNRAGQENTMVSFTDSTIILTMHIFNLMEQVYDYRICDVNDPTSISNKAILFLNPALNPDYPVAHNDTTIGIRGYPVYVNPLKNDYHPLGDSILLYLGSFIPDSILIIDCPEYSNSDYLIRNYFISDTSEMFQRFDRGLVYIKLLNSEWYDSLDLNNINARFNCHGMQFWDFENPHFKVPNGSESTSIFTQSLWMGGLDETGNLHVAAERYRQIGTDYWTGPVSDVYDTLYDQRWLHVWNLKRTEVEFHKAHWQQAGYELLYDILSWPGNGDVNYGQSEIIAPFDDLNNNGIYEPMLGDAPLIRGDQALFFVYNDCRELHTETEGVPIGAEIRAMAYAFDQPDDSALWNTIFIHYDIENKSDTAYHDMFLGVWTDTDLGNASDDYVGCDVEKGMYFVYNGLEIDAGGYESYGEHPPAQGILFLGGPALENDGIDNPKYDALGLQIVDESINGLNFGDGIIDNERMGMTRFIFHNNSGNVTGDPNYAVEYYDYLQNIWRDDSKVQYGGFGHPTNGAIGPSCNFMFPGGTDPYNWGTMGLFPNGGYNQNGLYWTEEQVNANPDDRRGLGSSGPFILLPGQTQSLDIALPWARDYNGTAWSSAELLKERATYIKDKFQNNPGFFSRVEQKQFKNHTVFVYPNPVKNEMMVRLPESGNFENLAVYSLLGSKLLEINLHSAKDELKLDCTSLSSGIYILQLNAKSQSYRTKFIKK